MEPSDNCAICMEALGEDGVPLNCGHLYHAKCVIPWLQKGNRSCPTCRDKPPRQRLDDGDSDGSWSRGRIPGAGLHGWGM